MYVNKGVFIVIDKLKKIVIRNLLKRIVNIIKP